MHLEHMLRDVQTDRGSLLHGRLLRWQFDTVTLARRCRRGASTPSPQADPAQVLAWCSRIRAECRHHFGPVIRRPSGRLSAGRSWLPVLDPTAGPTALWVTLGGTCLFPHNEDASPPRPDRRPGSHAAPRAGCHHPGGSLFLVAPNTDAHGNPRPAPTAGPETGAVASTS